LGQECCKRMQPEGLVGENEMKRNGGVGLNSEETERLLFSEGSIDARPAKGAGHWGGGQRETRAIPSAMAARATDRFSLGWDRAERRNGGGKGAGKSRVWETPYDSMSAEIPADASAAVPPLGQGGPLDGVEEDSWSKSGIGQLMHRAAKWAELPRIQEQKKGLGYNPVRRGQGRPFAGK
jgi:hypothetical protein